ncbi:hypothetical protein OKJ48_05140 [Streptomyces kunmingensis]|uniref:Uncharacterized protein n=1 Tax=Streptomyces kunmingensis TaxID=68225 RepID=A0ABU6C4U3_9ACTN|nr:hypothetical protein [Streptomyces kunmingensis]MEB3959637.1 hypothetical protein [Streptomyces kunmingensis]
MCISLAAARVEPCCRDERDDVAASISLTELSELGLDAVRYLNVWEASGSISLAIKPDVITGVQSIPIPEALEPVDELPPPLIGALQDLERRDEAPATAGERRQRSYDLRPELENTLVAQFLPTVNLEVATKTHKQSLIPTVETVVILSGTLAFSHSTPGC